MQEVGVILVDICKEGGRDVEKYFSWIQSLQKKLEEAEQHRDPSCEANKPMTQESLATLDKLSLYLDAL